MTNVDGDISFQNTSASDREIVQDEILEAAASQTESQQSWNRRSSMEIDETEEVICSLPNCLLSAMQICSTSLC